MNEISEVMPLQFILIFKNTKEHIQERNPMNVTNVEKPLHVSEVFKFIRIYTIQTPYQYSQCGIFFIYLLSRRFWTCTYHLFNVYAHCDMSAMKLHRWALLQHSSPSAVTQMVIAVEAFFPCLLS